MVKKSIVFLSILIAPFIVFAFPKGDVNGDDHVRSDDYILVRKHILKQITLTGEKFERANINGDKYVNSADYVAIRKIILSGESVTTSTPTPTATPVPTSTPTPTATPSPTPKPTATPTPVPTPSNLKTHDMRNKAVKAFLNNPDKIKSAYDDNKCGNNRCDYPNEYTSSISGDINIYEYDLITGEKKSIASTASKYLNYYLVPGKTYYIESKSSSKRNEYVKVTGGLRMLKIEGLRNVRDLGGWTTVSGTVKYGIIFRGARPDDMKSFSAFNILGIKKMIDLRRDDELSSVRSKWISDIKKIDTQYNISGYHADSEKTRAAVRAVMNAVVDGKHVYFNCAGGRDRTGTLAYLLEGILGVKPEYRYEDYELTYFDKAATSLTRNHGSFRRLISDVLNYDENNDEISFVKWFINGSTSKADDIKLINKFRKKMISGNPKEYKLSNDTVVYAE